MKKIYVSIFIFLLLICLSSFSFATTYDGSTEFTISDDNINFDLVLQKVYELLNGLNVDVSTYQFFMSYNHHLSFWINNQYEYYDAVIVYAYKTSSDYTFTLSSNIPVFTATTETGNRDDLYYFKFSSNYYTFRDTSITRSDIFYVMENQSYYGRTSLAYKTSVDIYGTEYYDSNTLVFSSTDNPLPTLPGEDEGGEGEGESGGESGGEGEGESGGETEESGIIDFITNFWDNVLHIVVPTDEQWQEVQDDWQQDVLGKFNIQAWTYNEEDYSYSNSWEWQNGNAPTININILGANSTIDMQSVNTWLNTPFDFGQKKLYYSGGGSEMITIIDNGGLTIRKLLNIILTIDLFVANIYLYNKFFSKED